MAQKVYKGSDRDLPITLKVGGDFFDLTSFNSATDSIVAKFCLDAGGEQTYTLDNSLTELAITTAAQGKINIPLTQAKTALMASGLQDIQVEVILAGKKTIWHQVEFIEVLEGIQC